MEFSFTEGRYTPSLFRIYIDTDVSLDTLANLSPDELSVYFHEYFHYLQDLTCPFTVNLMWRLYGCAAELIKYAQLPGRVVRLPLRDMPEFKLLDSQVRFINAILGNQTFIIDGVPVCGRIKVVSAISAVLNGFSDIPESSTIEFTELELEENTGKKGAYAFGAIAVIETMTYLIQRKFFGDQLVSEAPYLVGKRLAEYCCPGVGGNDEYVFVVCDLAMRSPYPGWTFYELLQFLQVHLPQPKSAEEIYMVGGPFLEQRWGYPESFERYHDKVSYIVSVLAGNEVFKDLRDWLTTILEEGWQLRIGDPLLMLKLYRERTAFNLYLFNIRERLGMPECVNRLHYRWFAAPATLRDRELRIDPAILTAIIQLQETLLNGRTCCSLYDQCRTSVRPMPINADCLTAPWKKGLLKEACAFGAVMISFGLEKNTFQTNRFTIDSVSVVVDESIGAQLYLYGYPNGKWVNAPVGGFKVRLDRPDPSQGKLHVHISRPKHINSPNKQVSWNVDGTRHDKHSFDKNFNGIESAMEIARRVMRLNDNITLQYRRTPGQILPAVPNGKWAIEVVRYSISRHQKVTISRWSDVMKRAYALRKTKGRGSWS